MLTLRPYQDEAVTQILSAFAGGQQAVAVQMPTGTGKTVVFADLIARMGGGPALVIAHRDELLEQAADKIGMANPGQFVGRVIGSSNDVHHQLVVASIQTIWRDNRLDQLPHDYKLIVVDEAHHSTAPTYVKVIERFKQDGAKILGVSATLRREDDRHLGAIYEDVVYEYGVLDAIRENYLADLRGQRITVRGFDSQRLRVRRGDFVDSEVADALSDADAPAVAARAYKENAADRRGIVFTPTVALADEMAEAFNAEGIVCEAISGDLTMEYRRAVLGRLRSGETQVVANCAVLTEGFDEPRVDCIVIARPTRSKTLYVQMVGRGTRKHPDKTDCLVMDLVGVTERHDLLSLSALAGELHPEAQKQLAVGAASLAEAAAMSDDFMEFDMEQMKRDEREAARQAKIEAKHVDLFGNAAFSWMQVEPSTWAVSAGKGMLVTIEADGAGTFKVMRYEPNTEPLEVQAGLDVGYAQGHAEDHIRSLGAGALADRQAGWRQSPCSPKQWALMQDLGIKIDASQVVTKGEASDLISAFFARRTLRRSRRSA